MTFDPPVHLGHPATLAHALARRALLTPDRTAFVFVDGQGRERSCTYRELDRNARAVARLIRERGLEGSAVVLAMPAGLAFIDAFFGCLYGRAIAVPVALPRLAKKHDAERRRLVGIIERAAPGALFTVGALLPFFETAIERGAVPLISNLVATDELDPTGAEDLPFKPPRPGQLAMMQFTSGSTAAPRGVLIRHDNIMANLRMVTAGLGDDSDGVFGGWLPHYHDLGLFGLIAQPVYLGCPSVLMAPIHFLRRPMAWLELISRHRVTTSGGPSFGYERCARLATDDDVAALDLRSWKVAFDGGEAVSAEVHRAFAERFAPCGFSRDAFVPCYGLAEATLMVSGGPVGRGPRVRRVSLERLSRGHVVDATGSEPAVELTGCGEAARGATVRIVHPETSGRLPDGRVGEIWVAGPQVASGYLGGGESTRGTFRAYLGAEGPFLRTGDLGFFDDGELFVAGRLKELIVIRGRNFFPTDLEATVARALGVPTPRVAVIEARDRRAVNVLVEGLGRAALAQLASVVRQALFDAHGVATRQVQRVGLGDMPRTASGKKRRLALPALFEAAVSVTTQRGAR